MALRTLVLLACALRAACVPAGLRKQTLKASSLGTAVSFDAYTPSDTRNASLPLVIMLSGFCIPGDTQDDVRSRCCACKRGVASRHVTHNRCCASYCRSNCATPT